MKNIAKYGLTLVVLAGIATSFYAADKAAPKKPKAETKTTVNSGHFKYSLRLGQAIYTTNVVVIDPQIDIFTDKMTVYFAKKKPKSKAPAPVVIKPKGKKVPLKPLGGIGGNVEKIVCEGHVIIVKKDAKEKATASGDKAVYMAATEQIVITGNAHLKNEKITVLGKVIVYDRRTGDLEAMQSTVSSGGTGSDKEKPTPKNPDGK